MSASAMLSLELVGIDAEPIEVSTPAGVASLETLMSGHAMTEIAASCAGLAGSCCIACCCCCV